MSNTHVKFYSGENAYLVNQRDEYGNATYADMELLWLAVPLGNNL